MNSKKDLPELPQWLQEALPETMEPRVLDIDEDGQLVLKHPSGAVDFLGTRDIIDAYDIVDDRDLGLKFSKAVRKKFSKDSKWERMSLTIPTDGGK